MSSRQNSAEMKILPFFCPVRTAGVRLIAMIELTGVSKRYHGSVEVMEAIDLAVDTGEVVLVSGETGSGKSTLLKLLYAAELCDGGKVSMFGRDLARLRRSSIALLRRQLGVIPQTFALLSDQSALRNVSLALEVRAEPRRAMLMRAAEALTAVSFSGCADTPVSRLSIGQRQRVAIARALVGDPHVLIADEPTAHLDGPGQEMFIDALIDVQSRGGVAVVATNDHKLLAAGARCSWRHVELADGALRVIADRRPQLIDGVADADSSSELGRREEWEESIDTNVVPFPVAARAGGMSA